MEVGSPRTGLYICDAHADILWRMDQTDESFYDPASSLQQSYRRMTAGGMGLQVFALYAPSRWSAAEQFRAVCRCIDRFAHDIVGDGTKVAWVRSVEDLSRCVKEGRLCGMLSLEGGDCLEGDIRLLRVMHRLGVRALGLTWNRANAIADGVGEPRGAGLTAFGYHVIKEMEKLSMIVDLAHVSERAFWDVMEVARKPPIVSHANVKSVCAHRRNLSDDQIQALIEQRGWIGLSFVPAFVSLDEAARVTVDDWTRHLERVLELGGENAVGIGSDFDGMDETMADLTDGSRLPLLREHLEKRYGKRLAEKVLGQNFLQVLYALLPAH
jgi:membrane dipeptidase